MSDFLYYVISVSILLFGLFFILNHMTQGILFAWFKVKASRGKKVLVELSTQVGHYFVAGEIDDKVVNYTYKKKDKRVSIENQNCLFNILGVVGVWVDDSAAIVIIPSSGAAAKYDSEALDNLLKRAIMAPSLNEEMMKKILIAVIVVGVLALAATAAGFMAWSAVGEIQMSAVSGAVPAAVGL